jgi:hypothetical protein
VYTRTPRADEDGIRYVDLETVLKNSDYVSLHCPLTPQTKHMINKETLALMKPTAFLINTSRGALIDEPALIEALEKHQIAGAGLDVQETEPPKADNPLYTLDNVIATFRALNASKVATFEQGVIDVFRNLSWDYKTHNPCLLGKKIIIDGVLDNHRGLYFSVRTYAQNRIDDLARPFWLLDGKTLPDNRVSEGANLSAFISQGGAASVGEVFACEYFTVRTYKKGSAHVTFTRPDLVEKVNDIIARHYPGALPPVV